MTTPLIYWENNPLWGIEGHNVHIASWAADGKHDDNAEED